MLRIFKISHLDGDVAGQLIQQAVALIQQFQALLSKDLILFDLVVQIPDLAQDVIDFIHGALFAGACSVQLAQLCLFGCLYLAGRVVEQVGEGLHAGTEFAFIHRVIALILQTGKGGLDVVKGGADSVNAALVQGLGQCVQG